MARDSIGIGLMGVGTIGGQLVKSISDKAEALADIVGCPVVLRKVKVLPEDLSRPVVHGMPAQLFTTDEEEFFNEPGIDIIVEAMGGVEPALEYHHRALSTGRHVVTPNKELIAKHGADLTALAEEHDVSLLYEASVGAGFPLITPFKHDLATNEISGIYAIINGTTNYILTMMAREGMEFAAALKLAQEKGYAEPNPENDVEGIDAHYKLAILASLAFHTQVKPENVHHEGISRLSSRDFRYAAELGFAVKLLAIAKQVDNTIEARVHPVFIPEESQLAKINGVYNAVLVEGDMIDKVLFFGQGAGPLPTCSSIIADIVAAAQQVAGGGTRDRRRKDSGRSIKPMSEVTTRYYLRIKAADQPGVLAQIARILGDNQISIASAIQKETDPSTQAAEIVLMTHPAQEKAMQQALGEITGLKIVKEVSNFIRVEDDI